jgi:hypothetical protein
MSAQLAPGYDPRHWATTDGHRHTSVPAPEPLVWKRTRNDQGQLVYLSSCYSIVRTVGPNGSRTFVVYRDGIKLSLSFTGMLWCAKERAVVNAQGRDVVNVA